MVDLNTWSNYAEIFGAVVVMGGLGFAILELRQSRIHRDYKGRYA